MRARGKSSKKKIKIKERSLQVFEKRKEKMSNPLMKQKRTF